MPLNCPSIPRLASKSVASYKIKLDVVTRVFSTAPYIRGLQVYIPTRGYACTRPVSGVEYGSYMHFTGRLRYG